MSRSVVKDPNSAEHRLRRSACLEIDACLFSELNFLRYLTAWKVA
jgi:hypothetical protein